MAKKARKPRTTGLDMCPHCISFGCDPMSMSPAFRNRTSERLRMGLCPACGNPRELCRCRSSMDAKAPRGTVGRTKPSRKKLRRAMDRVRTLESISKAWDKLEALDDILGREAYSRISLDLYLHRKPRDPWPEARKALAAAGADPAAFAPAWET